MKKILRIIIICILSCALTSCKSPNKENNIIEDDANYIVECVYPWYDIGSSFNCMPVMIQDYSDKYTYDAWCDNGYVLTANDGTLHKSLTNIKNSYWIGWEPGTSLLDDEFDYFEKAYFVIVKKELDNIVGYIIISLVQDDDVYFAYDSKIEVIGNFSKVNDDFQNVPIDYIEEKLEGIKNYNS